VFASPGAPETYTRVFNVTIAACYLSPEGVVFGADSTSTITISSGASHITRYYDFAQKIFQVGEISTLGVVTWGMGGLSGHSYRTLIAQFADDLRRCPPLSDMNAVAQRWSGFFWGPYSQAFPAEFDRARVLRALPTRTPAEENELNALLQTFTVGFCFGGNLDHERTPKAFEVVFSPDQSVFPPPAPLQVGNIRFWGCPNLMERLIYGIDRQIFDAVLASGKWSGTESELLALVQPYFLQTISLLPIREAIDWVHASVYATLKMMRYSQLEPVCGGPVEAAVITADRPFRWVRHKGMDAAIGLHRD